VVSTRGYDLYNFSLVVDDKKFIDKYGQDTLLDNVLRVLLPYVQIEESGQCDYFNLLRQALANEPNEARFRSGANMPTREQALKYK
jgi:hypothetical protein